MSISQTLQNIIHSIGTTFQRVIQYVFSAAMRIFTPNNDNYPATGVQPFEGDPADKKSL
jgi:hypothetical protein